MGVFVYVCVCLNSIKSCHPASKANSEMPEATVSVSVGWPGLYNSLSNIFASVYNGCTFTGA